MQVDVYDGTPEFLRSLELDQDSLTKAIIGTIGDIDAYQLPDAKGYTAFLRHILGVTDDERQQRRDQILGTTIKDFRWPSSTSASVPSSSFGSWPGPEHLFSKQRHSAFARKNSLIAPVRKALPISSLL